MTTDAKLFDICFICDDNYAMPTMVCMQSIKDSMDRSKGYEYCVHIVSFALNAENIAGLKRMEESGFAVRIHLVDETPYRERLQAVTAKTHVTPTALLKFELPHIFSDLERILYLDSDIIVKGDISDLFATDIEGKYVAVQDSYWWCLDRMRYCFGRMKGAARGFNSGVLLYNIPLFIRDHVSEKLWDYKLHSAKSELMDQECLAAILGGNRVNVSIRYNFNPMMYHKYNLSEFNRLYQEDFTSLEDLYEKICIVHYMCPGKPWLYREVPFGKLWLSEYARVFPDQTLKLERLPIKEHAIFVYATPVHVWKYIGKRAVVSYMLFILCHLRDYAQEFSGKANI